MDASIAPPAAPPPSANAGAARLDSTMPSPKRSASRVNDLDLSNWKQYDDILTDSLWILDARDSSGAHHAEYHGNFIPQIPNQLLRRFTKAGDIVLDPFVGSGTTAIEATRLGRQYIGVELSPEVAERARHLIRRDSLRDGLWDDQRNGLPRFGSPPPPAADAGIITGDSAAAATAAQITHRLDAAGAGGVQLLIMHPPTTTSSNSATTRTI